MIFFEICVNITIVCFKGGIILLESLKPERVFYYFEEISKIPHGSGNTKAISNYCVTFAKEHGFSYIQDKWNNVIIIKEASIGREQDAGIVLQGHLDMVTVKEENCTIDFATDSLCLCIDGDELYAKGTSLGGDDGIAVAYTLALLEEDSLSHPRLEVVLTVDEEIGLLGATEIDLSMLKGQYLLNLDSEEEGIFLTSCAGGLRGDCVIPVLYLESEGVAYQIKLTGLTGGHSGAEIDKERANAIKLAGRLLSELEQEISYGICGIQGGEKDNAIATECELQLLVEEQESQRLEKLIQTRTSVYQAEYAISDPNLRIEIVKKGFCTTKRLQPAYQMKVVYLLANLPNGIQNRSLDIPGLVETSLNLGIVNLNLENLTVVASVRSSVRTRKEAISNQLRYITEFLGGVYHTRGDYPAWEYRKNSRLREVMVEIYKEKYGKEPLLQAIHAGLECGILLEKCPQLDAISLGPDMKDIHTTRERLSISSTKRVWEYLIEVIARL